MKNLHIITPVKDSIDSTIQTIEALMASVTDVNFHYTIYNDFSTEQTTTLLKEYSKRYNFELVNLSIASFSDQPLSSIILAITLAVIL